MPPDKQPSHSVNKNITISGDVVDSVVIAGDRNTVNQTIIQKFFNIFKSDAETLEHRNRRILLNHVENAWIKGVLDASLYGAAMLDLGIKETPEAIINKYPWAIKRESTDETFPAGTSMLEIFDSIGMGRSLLILGAPGSGKTTMLLELARQLIARAREDVTYPIPMVFNLASWTEKLTLADWLAQELNNLYSVPRKTAPDWIKGDKLLLLLDGLDEVRQESRAKCVEAINAFRKEHGLTSLAVCSRSQNYAELKSKLSFEGAIEVQPLKQEQIAEFFNRFGNEMERIMQALEKDSSLKELAETPLFLSIILIAYRDKHNPEILVSGDEKSRRKQLFDAYIRRNFEHRSEHTAFKKEDVLQQTSWLAVKAMEHNAIPYLLEDMQPAWLKDYKGIQRYGFASRIIAGLVIGIMLAAFVGQTYWLLNGIVIGVLYGLVSGLLFRKSIFSDEIPAHPIRTSLLVFFSTASFGGLYAILPYIYRKQPFVFDTQSALGFILLNVLVDAFFYGLIGVIFNLIINGGRRAKNDIEIVDALKWSWISLLKGIITGVGIGIVTGVAYGIVLGILFFIYGKLVNNQYNFGFVDGLTTGVRIGLFGGATLGMGVQLRKFLISRAIEPITAVGQGIRSSLKNGILVGLIVAIFNTLVFALYALIHMMEDSTRRTLFSSFDVRTAFYWGICSGIILFLFFGGYTVIQHLILRLILYKERKTPLNLKMFLDHCVDLIFLRRVGGGYIFVHRLLMEHFAELYTEHEIKTKQDS